MSAKPITENTLFYGDNLDILRNSIADESVDLIYLDPPFNSNASYNVLFKAPDGIQSQAQVEAFDDTWHWTESAEQAFDDVMKSGNSNASEMLRAMRVLLGTNDMMAYLAMMAVRLLELHRVLKSTGSLYLHCDPTASHYLKILLDAVFGKWQFGNEIIWKRTSAKGLASTRFAKNHDVIFRYTKSEKWIWNPHYKAHDKSYLDNFYTKTDEKTGRVYRLDNLINPSKNRPNLTYEFLGVTRVWRWTKERMTKAYEDGLIFQSKPGNVPSFIRFLDEQEGTPVDDIWTDIKPIQSQSKEGLGYPTQKPVALLERILAASSNEDDVVLDPFCGCGTTLHAAAKHKRKWIGIDVTHLAIGLIQRRLKDSFPTLPFIVIGVPKDIGGARALAQSDKYEFQKWALSMIEAQPFKGGKKGGDGGVDGYLYFKPDGKKTEKAVVSVKGGASLNPAMVKDLIVTVEQEGAKMGVFLTLEPPTKGMITQAAAAGVYKTDYGSFPKIQIITVEQLFEVNNPLRMPWQDKSGFKTAAREAPIQPKMDL